MKVFGSASGNIECKLDTSSFVQRPCSRTNSIESNKEDMDMKSQFNIKNLPNPFGSQEAAPKFYVDNKFNDSTIVKKTLHMLTLLRKILITMVLLKWTLIPL